MVNECHVGSIDGIYIYMATAEKCTKESGEIDVYSMGSMLCYGLQNLMNMCNAWSHLNGRPVETDSQCLIDIKSYYYVVHCARQVHV